MTMIIRMPRTKPLDLLAEEALIRRLPDRHPKKADVITQHRMTVSGHKGEVNTEFHIETADIPPFYIYCNPRLPYRPADYVQIDTLLVSRHLAIILEIKNNGGTSLYFKGDSEQLIQERWDETKEEYTEKTYNCPVEQARRQKSKLHIWLRTNRLPPIPIEYLAVMANDKPKILFSEDFRHKHRVVRRSHIESRLQRVLKNYPDEAITSDEQNRIDARILNDHTPFIPNLMKKYQLTINDLNKGVFCHTCPWQQLLRGPRGWRCHKCETRFNTKDVVMYALKDYWLLLGNTVTHKTFADFLKLEPHTATSILKKLHLPSEGRGRGKTYNLSPLFAAPELLKPLKKI
ncbi:hypothetical protein CR205_16780 [Alteribacter lacisalsi]|uniref:NERD domain-containing protein n=1 Tax=Alteribacter lacisalsi TaxID=2045244 RepID=A0A2W0H5W1_9BACI|nr:nuclease-related domain-containing protein [Alteribacter lacisalsi]PYZ96026.1 hypothetical protein CR205_16780 [Alteribacter lacisalsi]